MKLPSKVVKIELKKLVYEQQSKSVKLTKARRAILGQIWGASREKIKSALCIGWPVARLITYHGY
jgi:hypothetical protein